MNRKRPLISVIVPFYNDALYANRCIDSILSQSFSDFEIILIDDASKDGTYEILDSYSDFDNVTVVHNEINRGLSFNRNLGVKIARGIYISFIDGDDYISSHYLEFLFLGLASTSGNVVITSNPTVSRNGENVIFNEDDKPRFESLSPEKALIALGYEEIVSSACSKLAPRSVYLSNPFPVGRLYEEISTAHRFISSVDSVQCMNTSIYAYEMHSDSIVNKKDVDWNQVEDYEKAIDKAVGTIAKYGSIESSSYQECLQSARLLALLQRAKGDKRCIRGKRLKIKRRIKNNLATVIQDPRVDIKAKLRMILASYGTHLYMILIRLRDYTRLN